MTTDDGRFRPVDVKAGPDGALYVADLYEPRINHVDPRDNWDRATGRDLPRAARGLQARARAWIWRKLSSRELVALLGQPQPLVSRDGPALAGRPQGRQRQWRS